MNELNQFFSKFRKVAKSFRILSGDNKGLIRNHHWLCPVNVVLGETNFRLFRPEALLIMVAADNPTIDKLDSRGRQLRFIRRKLLTIMREEKK